MGVIEGGVVMPGGERVQTEVIGAAASTTAVHAAVTDNGAQQVVTTGINGPQVPARITATAGGTAGDIKAIQVIIAGTDPVGTAITETLDAFTVNTPGTVTGLKVFKTVTSITIPAHDGTGATTAIGFSDVLGLNHRLSRKSVKSAYLDAVLEGTAPTVVVNATDIESNTVDLNSALNSVPVVVEFVKS